MTKVRLAAHALQLWRREGLQLGVDPTRAVLIANPPDDLSSVLTDLHKPHSWVDFQARLAADLSECEATALLRRMWRAGLLVTDPPRRVADPIRVIGSDPLAAAIAAELRGPAIAAVVYRSWTGSQSWQEPPLGDGVLTVLVTGTAEPDRAITELLRRADEPHLVVRPVADGAEIGPLVVPGITPCIACLDLHCRHRDPEWPHLLNQLFTVSLAIPPAVHSWALGVVLAEVQAMLNGGVPSTLGRSVTCTTTDWTLRWRQWQAHPYCSCHPGANYQAE